ncbi:MAG: hypothetical protein GY757_45095, partial [bacterium]|nr:hypothetical protein [bacterium]
QLRNFLSEKLPDYMVPSYFVSLKKLPLNPNGKVDRKALPEPEAAAGITTGFVAPTGETEKKLAAIWGDVLGTKNIGVTDNFFEIGGHSLKAITIISKIQKTFRVELPLSVIFDKPFIKNMARSITHSKTSSFTAIQAVEKKDYYPVSATQKRMYTLNRITPDSVSYNISSAQTIAGNLSITSFEDAFQALIRRHETLRTSFHLIDEEPVQRIHEKLEFSVKTSELSQQEKRPELSQFIRPFTLSGAPLLRVELVKLKANKHIFFYDMHHIISDGVSLGIMIKEFAALYAGMELKTLNLQYKDYSAWQNRAMKSAELLNQKSYWQEKFSGELPVLTLPTDYPRPAVQSTEGDVIPFEISAELTGGLYRLAENSGATLFMILLALYTILLSKYSNQEDIVVGTPSAGRRHSDLASIIGIFINTLALRNAPHGEKSFSDYSKEVKQNSLEAFENQDYQLDHLLEHLDIKRDAGRNPLFDTIFSLQDPETEELELKGVTFKPYKSDRRTVQFDLGLQMQEKDSKISGTLGYCVKLFKKETMQTFVADFISTAEQIVTEPEVKLSAVKVDYEPREKLLLREFNQAGEEIRLTRAKEISTLLGIEIDAAIYEKVYPMTTLQRDFYLDSQRNPLSFGHRVSSYRLHHRALDEAKWEEAVKLVIKKYPLLRSGFLVEGDRFFQGVRKYTSHECDFLYLGREANTSRGPESAAGSRNGSENVLDIQQELYEEIKKITFIPHDVTLKPVKFFLIKLAPDLYASALSVHHAFLDGSSGMVVYDEVEENYDKLSKGETPAVQADHTYEDYIDFHNEHFDTGKVKRYWEKKLSTVEPVRGNQRARQASECVDRRFPLGLEGSKEIVAFCKRAGVSPAVYFKGLYGLMLHYYTRPTADFHIRDVASGRPPRYQSMVGPMILVIPTIVDTTRINGSNNVPITEYLQGFRRQKKELGDN